MNNTDNLTEKRHLVILGAGASIATIYEGDRYGNKIPAMDNFISKANLSDLLDELDLKTKSKNLEDIYAEIHSRTDCTNLRVELEKKIEDYLSAFKLPDNPTIYDMLILSLRGKDAIATFNWDPMLVEAYNRVNKITKDLPELLFLHSFISAGFCKIHNTFGLIQYNCPRCNKPFQKVPLLFPHKEKDYTSDTFINEQWSILKQYLRESEIITIFGYSAPPSDKSAIALFKEGFENGRKRTFDCIEIIDVKKKSELLHTWSHFIEKVGNYSLVYTPTKDYEEDVISKKDFFDSLIAEFPRRSVEGYRKRINGWWNGGTTKLTPDLSFVELTELIKPLIEEEVDIPKR